MSHNKMKICSQSARFKNKRPFRWGGFLGILTGIGFGIFFFWGTACGASEQETKLAPASVPVIASDRWRVVLAGFIRPPGIQIFPIPNAQSTHLAAAFQNDAGEWVLMSKEQFAAMGVEWEPFRQVSARAAAAQLEKLSPEWVRDKSGVIECAILRAGQGTEEGKSDGKEPRKSDNSNDAQADITGVLLVPEFLTRFTPVFGKKILVAIPDRQTIFIFPSLASRYQDYAEQVLQVYRRATAPVSREVLEVREDKASPFPGLRATGVFEE